MSSGLEWYQYNSSAIYFNWTAPMVANYRTLTSPKTNQTLMVYNVVLHSGDVTTAVELVRRLLP